MSETVDFLKEVAKEFGDEAVTLVETEAEALLLDSAEDALALGSGGIKNLIAWANFDMNPILDLSDDATMSEMADHEELLAARDKVFEQVATLERENAEAVARMKEKAKSFCGKIVDVLAEKGLKYLGMAALALV